MHMVPVPALVPGDGLFPEKDWLRMLKATPLWEPPALIRAKLVLFLRLLKICLQIRQCFFWRKKANDNTNFKRPWLCLLVKSMFHHVFGAFFLLFFWA